MTSAAMGPRPLSRRDPATPLLPEEFGPIRPALLSVEPAGNGRFRIDVRWQGRECILRAVVVRRVLADAGFDVRPGNSQDGRTWELKVGGVPSDRVADVVGLIW